MSFASILSPRGSLRTVIYFYSKANPATPVVTTIAQSQNSHSSTFSPNSTLRATFPLAGYTFHVSLPTSVKLTLKPSCSRPTCPSDIHDTQTFPRKIREAPGDLRHFSHCGTKTLAPRHFLGLPQTQDEKTQRRPEVVHPAFRPDCFYCANTNL